MCYCEICGNHTDTCECPECPGCGEVGNIECCGKDGHLVDVKRPVWIHSLKDLAVVVRGEYRGDGHDVGLIGKSLFKNTECGITFSEIEGGVLVAGYAEGSDGECPSHHLVYPFTAERFWSEVEEADREGSEAWDEANIDE